MHFKNSGAILSLSLLCGMQVYAFPDPSSSGGQIVQQNGYLPWGCQGFQW